MTTVLFVILYSLFAYVAWTQLRSALGIVIFLLPSYLLRFHIGPLPTTFLEGMIVIVAFIWILKNRDTGILNIYKSISQYLNILIWLPILLMLVASIISIFIAPNWYAALGVWRAYILEPLLFFVILLDTARKDEKTTTTIIIALAASACILSIIAIYQYFTGWMIPSPWRALPGRRVTSIFPYPNALGLYLAPIIVLLTGWSTRVKNKITSYGLLVTISLAIAAIAAAQSHGAIAGVAVGLFMIGIAHKKFRILTISTLILVSVIVAAYAPWRTYIGSYLTFTTTSGKIRIDQYKETTAMLRDGHWLFGTGLSGYKATVKQYHVNKRIEIYQYPHNIILNFWTELGLLGLLSFLLLLISIYTHAIRSIKKLLVTNYELLVPALAALTALLVHGLVDVPFFKNDLAILFWIIVALCVIPLHIVIMSPAEGSKKD